MEKIDSSVESVENYLRSSGASSDIIKSFEALKIVLGPQNSSSHAHSSDQSPKSSGDSTSTHLNSTDSKSKGKSVDGTEITTTEDQIAAVFNPTSELTANNASARKREVMLKSATKDEKRRAKELKKLLTFSNHIKLYNLMNIKHLSLEPKSYFDESRYRVGSDDYYDELHRDYFRDFDEDEYLREYYKELREQDSDFNDEDFENREFDEDADAEEENRLNQDYDWEYQLQRRQRQLADKHYTEHNEDYNRDGDYEDEEYDDEEYYDEEYDEDYEYDEYDASEFGAKDSIVDYDVETGTMVPNPDPNQKKNKFKKRGWSIGSSLRNLTFDPRDTKKYLYQVGDNWHLDIMELSNTPLLKRYGPIFIFGQVLLKPIANHIHKDFIKLINPVLNDIQDIYLPNPYHNALHGAMVAHMCKILANIVTRRRQLAPLEEFALIIAALAHDIGHPGLTNNFLNSTYNPLSLIYNDASTLENYHCSLLFHILRYNTNFFEIIPAKDWTWIRKRVIQLILSTDMSTHFYHIDNIKPKRETETFSFDNDDDYWFLLVLCMKTADIGHNFLPWVDHLPWTCALYKEFFAQGDAEKELDLPNLSPFDRDKASEIPKSQVTFFQMYLQPLFVELRHFGAEKYIEVLCANCEANVAMWERNLSRSIWDLLIQMYEVSDPARIPDLNTAS